MAVDETGEVNSIRRAVLRAYPQAWIFKVVGTGRQRSGVPDLLLSVNGLLFGLEVKHQRPGESYQHALSRATPGQLDQISKIQRSGGTAAVITSPDEALKIIRRRLEES